LQETTEDKKITIKISKLIEDSAIKRALECNEVRAIKNRRTGNTLGYVLTIIGQAMQHPGRKIQLVQYYHQGQWLANFTESLIDKLELQFLTVNRENNAFFIHYDIYKTIEITEKKNNDQTINRFYRGS